MKKKLFGILLTLCLVVCAFAISVSAATTISTAEELVALMNDSSKWAGDYILGADINLAGQTQSPIGNSGTKFTGTFDGDNHKIEGVAITTASSYTGLFGCVEGGTIKNLTVYGKVEASSDKKYIGGIVGFARGITMDNCHNYIDVTGSSESVGGVIGYIYYSYANITSSITNCTNHGTVNGGSYSGGIVGDIYTGNYAGLSVTIDGCKNYGAVTTSGNVAGGIIGYIRLRTTSAANVSEITVQNCANYNTITGADYVGGIFGAALTGATFYAKGTFRNLYNEGDMVVTSSSTTSYATPFAGGLAGLIRPSKLLDSSTSIELPFAISDVYNKGTVYRTKIGGTFLGGSVIGTLGAATENATINLDNICNANGETIILSASGLVNSTDGVLVYNNLATAVSTKTTVYGSNNFVSTSDEEEFNALAEQELWLAGWDSPELASFHVHTYVDGACACGEKSAVTLDSSIDSVDEYMLLMNDPTAWSEDYYLSASLDLTGYTLTPIGNADTAFTGSFDGKGYTISGFIVSGAGKAATEGIGLFGVIADGAEIKDLTVSGTVSGSETLGGIVGLGIAPFTITGCKADVTVTNSGARSGGIIGDVQFSAEAESKTVSITECTVSGSLSATGHVGGIVGRMYPTTASSVINVINIENCTNNATCSATTSTQADVGGIVGRIAITAKTSFTLSGCVNNGKIEATTGYPVGGIIGEYITNGEYTSNITDCTNKGSVSSEGKYVGGIIGYYYNYGTSSLSSEFENIYNEGVINGTSCVGGIVGYLYNKPSSSASYSFKFITVENNGTVECTGQYAGGIIGYLFNSATPDTAITAEGLVNYKSVTGTSGTGGIFGRHENTGKFNATQSQSFKKLANYGEINGSSYVGGIVGVTTTTSIPVTFDCFYNEGDVIASGNYAGGIFGFTRSYGVDYDEGGNEVTSAQHVSITNCENRGNVTVATNYVGGISGHFDKAAAICMSNTVTTGTVSAPSTATYCNAVIGEYAVDTYPHVLSGNYYTTGTDSNATLIETSTTYTDTLLYGDNVVWYTDATNTYAPELIEYHEHVAIGTKIDETYHRVACWCGDESAVIEHDYVQGGLAVKADKTAYYVYNCACGAVKEVLLETEEFGEGEITYGVSANVGNNLGMEILVKSTELFYDAKAQEHSGWLVVDAYDEDGNVTSTVVYAHKITQNQSTGIYTYRFNLPAIVAKKMGDKITSTFCGIIDGVEYTAESVDKNIVTYYSLAAANSDAESTLMTLLNAMLNYGAAAQTRFDYNAEYLVNSVLPADKQKSEFEAETTAKVSVENTCDADAYTASNLYAVLEQDVVVSLVLKPTGTTYAQSSLVFVGSYETIEGNTVSVKVAGDGFIADADGSITVDVEGISAKDLRQTITGALYHTDGTQLSDDISFSFECYATATYESGSEADKNICAAILEYCDAAIDYFAPSASAQ